MHHAFADVAKEPGQPWCRWAAPQASVLATPDAHHTLCWRSCMTCLQQQHLQMGVAGMPRHTVTCQRITCLSHKGTASPSAIQAQPHNTRTLLKFGPDAKLRVRHTPKTHNAPPKTKHNPSQLPCGWPESHMPLTHTHHSHTVTDAY